MSWTILSAIPKSEIMKRINMYEQQRLQPTIEKSLRLADEKYHIKEIKEDLKCDAENAGN